MRQFAQIIGCYVSRWNIEVTFAEIRAYLGLETQRHGSGRELFQRAASRHSLSRLVSWLTETGVPTRTRALADAGVSVRGIADTWSRVAVRAILINPVYKGEALFGRREAIFSEERTAEHPRGKRQ